MGKRRKEKKKKRKKRKNRRVVNWSELEKYALELIATRLTNLDDFIRFGAVCKTWRSIFLENRHLPRHQFPILMIPGMDYENNEFRSFFSFSEKQIYRLKKLPNEDKDRRCCGSSEGYLIMVDPYFNIFLLNPFSRIETPLPCLTTVSKFMDVYETYTGTFECTCRFPIPDHHTLVRIASYGGQYVYKAITAEPYVVAILYSQSLLAFCKLDGDGWTYMEDIVCLWEDIVCYNGNFYLINHRGRVVVLDMSGPHPTLTMIVELVDKVRYPQMYLVESSGQLLMVARYIDPRRWNYICKGTMDFTIFRVDVDKHLCFPLRSLGDGILFLGYNSSVSLSARDFSKRDGNRIYFPDEDLEDDDYCIRVYNVEDGSFGNYHKMMKMMDRKWPHPIWLTPKLW